MAIYQLLFSRSKSFSIEIYSSWHKRDFTSSLILDETNLNFFVIIAKIFRYWNDVWLWVFVRIYNHYHAYISFRIRNDDAADFEFEEEAWKSRGR